MLIQIDSLGELYQEILQTSLESGQIVSVLIFVPLNVDSIAAACLLLEILKKDNITNHIIPVYGYSDLLTNISQRAQNQTLPATIIMINCGGSIDIGNYFDDVIQECSIKPTFYVFDSHRPIHFENLDIRRTDIKIIDDSNSLFDDILSSLPDANPDSDSDNLVQIMGKPRSHSNFMQARIKTIDTTDPACIQFTTGTHFSDPASIQMYSLASACNSTSLRLLWYAVLGLTDHLNEEHIDISRYETFFNALQSEARRLNGDTELFKKVTIDDTETVSPVTIEVPVSTDLFIIPTVEIRCPLHRNWTLYESMESSTFLSTRLRMWQHGGEDRLKLFLAKMGIPLTEARNSYIAIHSDIRDSLVRRFDEQCDIFGLTGITYPTFLLKAGFRIPIPAADFVYAVRALLSSSDNFLNSFLTLQTIGSDSLLFEGIEQAKARARLVTSMGMNLMSRKTTAIIDAGPFKIAYLHNAEEKNFPIKNDTLEDLALYLCQSLKEDTSNENEDNKPVIVAAFEKTSNMWAVVAVSTGFEFGQVEKSRFGEYFAAAARKAEIEIVQDSFESCMCKVPNDNMFTFIDQLNLLAWGYDST